MEAKETLLCCTHGPLHRLLVPAPEMLPSLFKLKTAAADHSFRTGRYLVFLFCCLSPASQQLAPRTWMTTDNTWKTQPTVPSCRQIFPTVPPGRQCLPFTPPPAIAVTPSRQDTVNTMDSINTEWQSQIDNDNFQMAKIKTIITWTYYEHIY